MIAKSHLFARDLRVGASPVGGSLLERVQLWLERRHQRRTLLGLNDHLLKDIGVSRSEAWAEGQKPFWRP
jgi:uncharacterized protein YjiS (DUF1127 family)